MVQEIIVDTNAIRKLPLEERLEKLTEIFHNSNDESERWDAVWMTGELAEETGLKGPIYDKAGDLLAWALLNDENCIVRHESSYQIVGRNYHNHISDLVESALHDKSPLVRHESCECLSIIQALDAMPDIEKLLDDPVEIVRETARFSLKRLERTRNHKTEDWKEDRQFTSF